MLLCPLLPLRPDIGKRSIAGRDGEEDAEAVTRIVVKMIRPAKAAPQKRMTRTIVGTRIIIAQGATGRDRRLEEVQAPATEDVEGIIESVHASLCSFFR